MQNPADITQAIQALQREMQKVLDEIKQKEEEIKKIEEGNNALSAAIKVDDASIQQKQSEILRLKQDIDIKKREIAAASQKENLDKQRLQQFKLEQIQENNKIGNLNREQRDALAQKNIRH